MNFMKNSVFKSRTRPNNPRNRFCMAVSLRFGAAPAVAKPQWQPSLPSILPTSEKCGLAFVRYDSTYASLHLSTFGFGVRKSLGSILAAPHVNESLVKYHMITHKKMDHLTILGMLKGENEYSYTPFGETQARELIESLRKIAPFIIIDCGSYIANDVLSAVALLESDAVLRLANCDLKSVSYLSSQLSTLQSAGLDFEKQYKCAQHPEQSRYRAYGRCYGKPLASSSRIPRNWNSSTFEGNLFSDLTPKG